MSIRSTGEASRRLSACAALCLLACKDRRPPPSQEVAAVAPELPRVDDASREQSTIAGSVRGAPFTHIAAAFVIENPDSDATTVVYLFSNPVRCLDLSFAGWDQTIASGTWSWSSSFWARLRALFSR